MWTICPILSCLTPCKCFRVPSSGPDNVHLKLQWSAGHLKSGLLPLQYSCHWPHGYISCELSLNTLCIYNPDIQQLVFIVIDCVCHKSSWLLALISVKWRWTTIDLRYTRITSERVEWVQFEIWLLNILTTFSQPQINLPSWWHFTGFSSVWGWY